MSLCILIITFLLPVILPPQPSLPPTNPQPYPYPTLPLYRILLYLSSFLTFLPLSINELTTNNINYWTVLRRDIVLGQQGEGREWTQGDFTKMAKVSWEAAGTLSLLSTLSYFLHTLFHPYLPSPLLHLLPLLPYLSLHLTLKPHYSSPTPISTLLHMGYRTALAPFSPVTFVDTLTGDFITSMVRPLQDISGVTVNLIYTASKYASLRPVASYLEDGAVLRDYVLTACVVSPLAWRYMQNLRNVHDERARIPHALNAVKYMASAFVGVWGMGGNGRGIGWITCVCGSTVYQVIWDFYMDWGLGGRRFEKGRKSGGRIGWERYRWMILINIILRFGWTLTLVPPGWLFGFDGGVGNIGTIWGEKGIGRFMAAGLGVAEIGRRFMWLVGRIENEVRKEEGKGINCDDEEGAGLLDGEGELEEDGGMMKMEIEGGEVDIRKMGGLTCRMKDMNEVAVLVELVLEAALFFVATYGVAL